MKYNKGYHVRNTISFLSLSNKKRKRMWYKINYDIKKQQVELHDNRLFYSYDCFHYFDKETNEEISLNLSWADIQFPSRLCKNKIYMVFFATCQYTMMEEIQQKIFDEIYNETISYTQDDLIFNKDHTISLVKTPIPKYENRNRYEESDKRFNDWLKEQYQNPNYLIYQHWTFSKDIMSYAIPIEVVLDVPYLSVKIINDWINLFIKNGEVEYTSSEPVPQEHLIYSKDWMKQLQTGIANPLIL